MKSIKKDSIIIALIFALFVSILVPCHVFAGDTKTVSLQGTYKQTSARKMLTMINNFRTGDDSWQYDEKGNKEVIIGLKKLKYDYGLEKLAMRRAMEIAVQFSHTRPAGGEVYGMSIHVFGENIGYGYGMYQTTKEIFEGFKETGEKYPGQGHRRNMLRKDITAVGIAHLKINGYDFWVQEFGESTGVKKTKALDGAGKCRVTVMSDTITGYGKVKKKKTIKLSTSVVSSGIPLYTSTKGKK